MIVTYARQHNLHAPEQFVARGRVTPNYEVPSRAETLRNAFERRGHLIVPPRDFGMESVSAVHDEAYLAFLESAFRRWAALPNAGDLVQAHASPHRSHLHCPSSIQGQVGFYLSGTLCPMGAGTWEAARWSANCALEAAEHLLQGAREAYAVCRPPGHHAYADFASGFCYLNNVAIAAHRIAATLGRVAILDIDAHHGNGTQSIFYERSDVHFVSVHADPNHFAPFYAGYIDERGRGTGLGHTLNLPLSANTADDGWLDAIDQGLASIRSYGPKALLISLGFDAFTGDPTCDLAVSSEGFRIAGRHIGAIGCPVLMVQEGGYVVDCLEANLNAFLDGFLSARPPLHNVSNPSDEIYGD